MVLVTDSTNLEKKRKKIPTHIISFDDDEEVGQVNTSTSAPASCLSTPMTGEREPVDSGGTVEQAKAQWDERLLLLLLLSLLLLLLLKLLMFSSENYEDGKVLTPVNDSGNMGGLVPISPLDKSLEDMLVALPSYLDVRNEFFC